MHDFKHLTAKKKLTIRLLNRRRTLRVNLPKGVDQEPRKDRRLRYILPAVALLLGVYPLYSVTTTASTSPKATASVMQKEKPAPVKYLAAMDPSQAFTQSYRLLCNAKPEGEKVTATLQDGGKVEYALNAELQARVQKVMADNRVPYGAFVALEPKTGRILALAGHSSLKPEWQDRSCFDLYPMASLFKIVTAAAAMEQKKVGPDTVVAFNGKNTSENPRYWEVRQGRGNQQIQLAVAMGKSINPVFGRLASDYVGRDSMMSMASRFGFNQTLFPGTPVNPSRAAEPQTDAELKLMGAGLGREVKISPLHAAAMMGAIANNGVMMLPLLADRVTNGKGEVIFQEQPTAIRKLVDPETSQQLARTLSLTVKSGTSRKAFVDRKGRRKLADINVMAKTGSINGKDPEGHYSWFAAYAPAENPQIALVALVINQDKWKIKASQLGEQALEAFFR